MQKPQWMTQYNLSQLKIMPRTPLHSSQHSNNNNYVLAFSVTSWVKQISTTSLLTNRLYPKPIPKTLTRYSNVLLTWKISTDLYADQRSVLMFISRMSLYCSYGIQLVQHEIFWDISCHKVITSTCQSNPFSVGANVNNLTR
jgi:hypothetical protein